MLFFVSIENVVAVEADSEEEAKNEAVQLFQEWMGKGEIDFTVESEDEG